MPPRLSVAVPDKVLSSVKCIGNRFAARRMFKTSVSSWASATSLLKSVAVREKCVMSTQAVLQRSRVTDDAKVPQRAMMVLIIFSFLLGDPIISRRSLR